MNLYEKRLFALLDRAAVPAPVGGVPLTGRASNPLCGDDVEVSTFLEDGRVRGVTHHTRGCALTRASAALLSDTIAGRTPAEALALRVRLLAAFNDRALSMPGGFEAIAEARLLPSRRRCVLLPWDALRDALEGRPLD